MHAVIFLGFMTLLVRKVQLLVIGYDETFVYPGLPAGCSRASRIRRACGAHCRRLRALAAARAETRPARAQPRGAADPVADRGDHGHRFPVRRLPLRAQGAGRSGDRARAIVRLRRQRDRPDVFRTVARTAGRRIPSVVLDPDADGVHVPRDPAGRRAFPHRHRAAHALLPARRAGQPRAGGGPGSDHGGSDAERHEDRRAYRARLELEGRARCVHVHRMRAVQGRVPDLSDRQAAGAEMGLRQSQAALWSSATRSSPATKQRCRLSLARSSRRRRCGPARRAAIARPRARSSSSICRASTGCASTRS